MFTEASGALYNATRKRAYFRSVTILVPQTWRERNYTNANFEKYASADVIVAGAHPLYKNGPYTLQYGGCGVPGTYIHLTPDYVKNSANSVDFGPRGKVIVHEWAHYRWGVFNEYPTRGYREFYLEDGGNIQATRCPDNLAGVNRIVTEVNGAASIGGSCTISDETRLPDSLDCRFVRNFRQPEKLQSSIMSHPAISEVLTFCHSNESDPTNLHNIHAPNEHNRFCNLRSVWDVILDSPDFAAEQNLPREENSTTPIFNIVRAVPERFVLVMDVSGSMRGKKLMDLQKAASQFIRNFVVNGSFIGLVQFSSFATVLAELTQVDDSRESLVSLLPTTAIGGTGIGLGIRSGIEVLSRDGANPSGGNLIVLTDGEETSSPRVASIVDEVLAANVTVNSVFFEIADINVNQDLRNLSDETSGTWFIANGVGDSADIIRIFQALSQTEDGDVSAQSVQIESVFISQGSTNFMDTVAIDSTIGIHTVFSFGWTFYNNVPTIRLKPPNSNCYYTNDESSNLPNCSATSIHAEESAFRSIMFNIPGVAEVGMWEYNITKRQDEEMTVTVTSTASDPNIEPVIVESGLTQTSISSIQPATVFARVSQGFLPLLNAKAVARITKPDGDIESTELFDSGSGADLRANDGLYSRFFTGFTSQGRYSVQVRIERNGQSTTARRVSGVGFDVGYQGEDGTFHGNPNGFANEPSDEVVEAEVTGSLSRVSSGGGVAYSGPPIVGDMFGPNQITDLTVDQVDLDNATAGIILRFTAPGDNLDSGNASRYEIRFTYGNSTELIRNFNETHLINETHVGNGSLQPSPAFTYEEIVIFLHSFPNETDSIGVAIGIVAYDNATNVSPLSNVVTTRFFIVPPPLPPAAERDIIPIIVGSVVGAVGLILVVGIIVYFIRKKSTKKN